MSLFIHLLLIGLRRLWRLWLWICFLVCWFVLSLSLLFLELPTHQASIEQWLSTTLSQPVTIGRMTTYWTGLKPTIALYHLQVLEPNHQKSILEIGYIEIQINLIESIKQKQLLTAGIILSQAQLTLAQNRAGQINLVGLQPQTNENNKNNEKLYHWLLLQPHFSLHAHRLTWQTSQQDSLVFVSPYGILQRQPEGYQITVQVSLPQQMISPLQRGTLLFKGSSHWKNNRFTLLTGQIIAQQFQLVTEQHLLKLPHLQGQLTVRPSRNKTWQITVKKLLLNHSQPPVDNELNLKLIFQKYSTEITAQLKFLPAELLFAGITELNLQPSLKNFSGNLYDIQWSSNLTVANWRLKAKFNQLTTQLEDISSSETLNPRTLQVQNLDGQVEMTANSGQISMNTGTIRWSDARLYSHPFVFQQLKGEMSWQQAIRSQGTQRLRRGIRQREWQLRTEGIRAVDQNSSLLLVGNITIPLEGGIPESDLTITVNGGQLAQLHRYIPDNRLPYLAQWLKTALVSGQLHTANITFQGAINQLFTGKDKGFGLKAVVKNLHFNYAPHWPPFDDLDAEILINHQQLTVVTRSGTLLRKKIKEVRARVENLYSHTPLLYLEGQLQSTLVDSLQFIRESPLHRIMNFDHLELAGTIELDLKMAMSLPNIQLNSIAGQISLKDTTLTEKSTGITLEKMKGLIHFDRNTVTSEKMDGELFGKPIRLSFVKKLDDPLKPLLIQLNGQADSDFIHRQWVHFSPSSVDFPLSAIVSGDTAWRATLEVTQPLGGQNIHLYVETDFTGLAIDLPAPFKKTKDTPWTSHLDLHFSTTGKDTLQIQCGPILQGMFLIENKVLERGSLWLGATQSLQISDTGGISVIGHLTDFSITAWRDWFSTTLTTPKVIPQGDTENNLSWLGDLNLSFDRLEVLGQMFAKMTIRRQQQTAQWKISLNSAELEGYLTFNRDQKIPSLNLVFERLTLMTPHTLKEESTTAPLPPQEEISEPMDLRQLPAIAFHCSALQIGEINLGNVNFYTQPTEEGLQIDLFEAKAAHFSVQAKGQWQHRQQQTSIELNLHGDNVGQLLSRFGYRSLPLVGQKTQVNLTATWPGPPHAFKLATVKAGLDLVIINGQILTVEPGAAGRLFGLFDLQALPRRLTLDFRDVFNAGFGFDSISGNFVVGEGRAYTENLVLQSPVAHILIQGYTDLIHKNFNQTAIVIPHVSNALPVAGALAGGLSIGAIVLVVQKILQAEIEKAVNYQYSIKGSWAKPEVVLVSKESSEP